MTLSEGDNLGGVSRGSVSGTFTDSSAGCDCGTSARILAACAMAPIPEASEKTPQQASQPKNTAQRPINTNRSGLLLSKLIPNPIKRDDTIIVAPSAASRTPALRFSIQVFSFFGVLVLFLPAFEERGCLASARAAALRSAPQARQNLSLSTSWAAHWGQYMCHLLNLHYSISLKQAPQTGSSGISSNVSVATLSLLSAARD